MAQPDINSTQIDTGLSIDDIVKLEGIGSPPAAGLPAVDASQVLNVNALFLNGSMAGATIGDLLQVVGVGSPAVAGLPAIDGSQLTNLPYIPLIINTQTGTSYTLALTDAGIYIRMTNAAANTVTVPPNSSVAFDIGTEIIVRQAGAGVTTIAEGSGVTVNTVGGSPRALSISEQHASLSLIKVGTNEWDLAGSVV